MIDRWLVALIESLRRQASRMQPTDEGYYEPEFARLLVRAYEVLCHDEDYDPADYLEWRDYWLIDVRKSLVEWGKLKKPLITQEQIKEKGENL